MPLHWNSVTLHLLLRLPEAAFERHLAASPYVVGEELVEQISAHVRRERLGYYPALDYFRQQGGIDPELLAAAEDIGWFASSLAAEEIRRRLRPVFSSLVFESQQLVAFTLPGVRPGQPNARDALLRHYTPDQVKVGLRATSIQRHADAEAMVGWARHLTLRWLQDSFDSVEIRSAEASGRGSAEKS
ncbi:hypothetical protein QVG61_07305 [Thiohalobacter sp. IOR34]|uniref:hypothetical protein n=1 Tax=Thiohalobacter sp. IOR34 TaxID=3057176 RepID=UPI0025B11045|nr:hypothetical protein [Thiohalobacter sp. IOR34]WJW74327.1 hypothetical protein QVG61_07305 [Thiohalobacter sp. IOR34]